MAATVGDILKHRRLAITLLSRSQTTVIWERDCVPSPGSGNETVEVGGGSGLCRLQWLWVLVQFDRAIRKSEGLTHETTVS